MEEISKVKKEIKQLRQNMRLLDALASSDARNAKRLDTLKASPQSEAVQAEIARIRRSLDSVCAKKLSCDIMRLEEKYMRAINSLPSFDKTIFLEFFIEGLPYWKIGMNTGYSEDGIRKRIYKMAEKIAACVSPDK